MERFLHGNPLLKSVRPGFTSCEGDVTRVKLRKLQLLLSREQIAPSDTESLRHCIALCTPSLSPCALVSDEQVAEVRRLLAEWTLPVCKLEDSWSRLAQIPPQVPPRCRSAPFWVFYPKESKHMQVRIVSGVKRAPGRLPYVQTEISEDGVGQVKKAYLDEEDVDLYIANGDSRESSELASNCLLCEVCLRACSFPVEPDDVGVGVQSILNPPSEEQLAKLRLERPSLTCSGCSMVVHAECVLARSFTDRAILYHLARTNSDWFCMRCLEGAPTSHALRFGYQLAGEMTRCEFEKVSAHTLSQVRLGKNASIEIIERTFWDLLADASPQLSILYGSDLDSKAVSGGQFPSAYDKTGWEPRQLALNTESVLKHLPDSAEITGVSRPWMYLGSPLSAFCWHAEDQFLCSVSYLHEGASKVWYTVPGVHRSRMELAIAAQLPDLRSANRDLHHHLVTLVDPHVLNHEFGLPIGRAVQRAGEFIITFPQAYHCGFNCGNNLAEAVNVACPDWLVHGRASVDAYARVKRPSVFSLDEIVWHMSGAVIARTEVRKHTALFCIDSLRESIALVENITLGGTLHTETLTTTKTCDSCNQFCYFFVCQSVSGASTCGHCVTEPLKVVFLRYPLGTLRDAVDRMVNLLDQCSEIRRSSRPIKRSRAS